jgi:hypothetical protein
MISAKEDSPMQYKLLGFSENGAVRRFIFKKAGDPTDPPYCVIADVALSRKFNVPLQDLPSLCARLLEASGENAGARTLIVTDADLTVCAAANSAAAKEIADRKATRSNRSRMAALASNHEAAPGPVGDMSPSGTRQ